MLYRHIRRKEVEMYDYRIVEQVSRKKKHMSGALRKVMVIFAALFVLMGIAISQAFMLPGFLLALLYFVYDIFSQRDYEYTMENGELTIDVIYGKKYRKTAHVLKLEDMEVTAPHWHEKVSKYKKNTGTEKLKKYDYTSYEDDVPYYTMIIKEDRIYWCDCGGLSEKDIESYTGTTICASKARWRAADEYLGAKEIYVTI